MSLTNLAQRMRAEVQRRGESRRTLQGGLALCMSLIGDTWSLALSRRDTLPSPREIETVRRDFTIPADAQQTSAGTSVVLYWSDRPIQQPSAARPVVMQERLL